MGPSNGGWCRRLSSSTWKGIQLGTNTGSEGTVGSFVAPSPYRWVCPMKRHRLIGTWVGSTVLDVLEWDEKRRRVDERHGKDEATCSRRRDGGAGRIGFRWEGTRERGRENTQGQPVPIQNVRREACRCRPPSVPECQAGLQLRTFGRKRVVLPGEKQKPIEEEDHLSSREFATIEDKN